MSDRPGHEPVALAEPEGKAVPVVYSSPHSGTVYPEDFGHVVDPFLLVGGEDRFVDDLVADAPAHGIALIRALFARTYVDPNRDASDLDPLLIGEDWPEAVEAGIHSARGVGLIFRLIGDAVPIYDRRLATAEIRHRLDAYWTPFHDRLGGRIDALASRHGAVWHVDWHSMQPVGNALSPDPGAKRPDFVIGDRFGKSCEPEFTAFVAGTLRALGYRTALNEPYAGAYIVARHGDPARGRHSLQIEINRGLYMDGTSLERLDGFATLRRSLDVFSAKLAEWAADRETSR